MLTKTKARWIMKLAKATVICFLILGFSGFLFAQSPGEEDDSLDKTVTERTSLIEITRLEAKDPLYSIELRSASLEDFFRLLAHDYDINVLVDDRVNGTMSASFTNISLEAALENIAQMNGLILEKNKGVTIVKPNLINKTIIFKHIDAVAFLNGNAVTAMGSQATGDSAGGSTTEFEAATGSEDGGGLATVYDLLSDLGQILLGRQRNLIMVIDYPENVEKIESFAKAVDGKMASRVFKLKYISSRQLATEIEEEEDGEWSLEAAGGAGQ